MDDQRTNREGGDRMSLGLKIFLCVLTGLALLITLMDVIAVLLAKWQSGK
jgi:hypothetical protein